MEVSLRTMNGSNISYEAGMAPPIGGVESGGRRRDFSLADMAAISGSWVSYILTSRANLRTPEREADDQHDKLYHLPRMTCSL